MTRAKYLLRFLKGQPDLPIVYQSGNFTLQGFSDANFAADPDKRRSTSGYIFLFGGGLLSWARVLQKLVAQCTVESELIALDAGKEAIYTSNMLTELGYGSFFSSVKVFGDNTGSLSLASNSCYSGRTKHCALRFWFLRALVADGKITVHHVPSANQLADICTKYVTRATLNRLVAMITAYSA